MSLIAHLRYTEDADISITRLSASFGCIAGQLDKQWALAGQNSQPHLCQHCANQTSPHSLVSLTLSLTLTNPKHKVNDEHYSSQNSDISCDIYLLIALLMDSYTVNAIQYSIHFRFQRSGDLSHTSSSSGTRLLCLQLLQSIHHCVLVCWLRLAIYRTTS